MAAFFWFTMSTDRWNIVSTMSFNLWTLLLGMRSTTIRLSHAGPSSTNGPKMIRAIPSALIAPLREHTMLSYVQQIHWAVSLTRSI